MGKKLKDIDSISKDADFYKYLTKYIEKFQKAVSKQEFNDAYELSEWISIGYFSFDCRKTAEQLFKSTYLDTMKTLLLSNMFKKIKYEKDYFINLLVPLINFSDAYELFNNELAKKSYLEMLIDDAINSDYLNKFNEDFTHYNILLHLLKVIHNITHTIENPVTQRKTEFQELLSKIILKCGEDKHVLKLFATLLLAYTVAGEEMDEIHKRKLNITMDTVKYLINMTKNINAKDKRCQGFPLKSILNGIRYVCATSELCDEFVKQNGLDLISEVLNTSKDANEIEPALEIMLHVVLDCPASKLADLVNKYKLSEITALHKSNKNALIFRNCTHIDLHISKSTKSKEELKQNFKKDGYKFDIFISYCHRNKDIVTKIRTELVNNKYKLWFDEKDMTSDMYGAMAKGIENSHIVMVNVSSVYKSSAACKSEALYAKDLGKKMIYVNLEAKYKPTGWLGFIKAGTIYYELSDKKYKLNEMLTEIQKMMSNAYEQDSSDAEQLPDINPIIKTDVKSIKAIESGANTQPTVEMSHGDVQKWLEECGLEKFSESFQEVDGNTLSEFKQSMINNPSFFDSSMKEEYKMTFIDMSKLKKELRKLNI